MPSKRGHKAKKSVASSAWRIRYAITRRIGRSSRSCHRRRVSMAAMTKTTNGKKRVYKHSWAHPHRRIRRISPGWRAGGTPPMGTVPRFDLAWAARSRDVCDSCAKRIHRFREDVVLRGSEPLRAEDASDEAPSSQSICLQQTHGALSDEITPQHGKGGDKIPGRARQGMDTHPHESTKEGCWPAFAAVKYLLCEPTSSIMIATSKDLPKDIRRGWQNHPMQGHRDRWPNGGCRVTEPRHLDQFVGTVKRSPHEEYRGPIQPINEIAARMDYSTIGSLLPLYMVRQPASKNRNMARRTQHLFEVVY
mmetsp:Transcript_2418/g.6927  ORF Transcript_2418/g.6927 Transcript_2418/m.6927 type:complete len:306 (+) Transcript_2418:590-1507(+)